MPRGAAIDLVQSLFRTEPAARPVMAAHSDPENSFVIPLDEARTRFRYHQLFAEILRYLP